MRPYYVTTAITYPNAAPHIGHAYERIATDAIARFKRLDGFDVLFVTGMDEHGLKMQQTAAREGLTPIAPPPSSQPWASRSMLPPTILCARRSRVISRPRRRYGSVCRRTATSIS